jgi:hypothetical protein
MTNYQNWNIYATANTSTLHTDRIHNARSTPHQALLSHKRHLTLPLAARFKSS